MTEYQKQIIIAELRSVAQKLGSNAAVARSLELSEATISQIISGKYGAKGDEIYLKIAAKIGVQLSDNSWQLVETRGYKMINTVLEDAKKNSSFRAISDKAGSGKSTATRQFAIENPSSVFYLRCREWSRSKFLGQLMRLVGLTPSNDIDTGIEQLSDFFNRKSDDKPLLIIDEADKLKPSAIRLLIPLYNECENKFGVVIAGTDNLEKEFKRGVKYQQKGFDELMSRFGRSFVHLVGEDKKSVLNICKANGINDPSVSNDIFQSCEQVSVMVGTTYQTVIKDLRQLKSRIEGKKLQQQTQKNNALEGVAA